MGAWMGGALAMGLDGASPRLLALFACRLSMDAASLGLGGVLAWRVARAYPAWNKACQRVHGRSWGSLVLARRSAAGAAHPGALGVAMCCAFAASWITGRDDSFAITFLRPPSF